MKKENKHKHFNFRVNEKEYNKIKSKIGSNINQLTKLSNQGSITNVDLENVKEELKNIWQLLNLLIQNQN